MFMEWFKILCVVNISALWVLSGIVSITSDKFRFRFIGYILLATWFSTFIFMATNRIWI